MQHRRALTALAAIAAVTLAPSPREAAAFCGFFVDGAGADLFADATQVALMRDGTRTVLSMQNNYKGPPEDFALVVPVPVVLQEDNVRTLAHGLFDRLDQLAAPRLVEYWEQDPCRPPMPPPSMKMRSAPRPTFAPQSSADLGVTVEAQFVVGEYEIVILSAKDAAGLDVWLRQSGYKIPDGAAAVLRPYVQSGMKFFVARVDIDKVQRDGQGNAILSPLRFHYDSDEFALPVRLGLLNSPGQQDLIVHVLARGQRYEVANYKNVTIPTNLEVHEKVASRFGPFYAALFDYTVAKNPGAVVTEYAWDASSCDPCPTPALSMSEIASLGGDVIDGTGSGRPLPPSTPSRRVRRPPRPSGGYVLTRLHARYGRDTLGDDLVFRAAPPIVGGREHQGPKGGLEQQASPGSINNFQGRYVIRHPWTGKVACKDPHWGIWGGPGGRDKPGKAVAASKPGLVVRKALKLDRLVVQDVPEIGLKSRVKRRVKPRK